MVDESQNLSFHERQLQIIEEGRSIQQQVSLLRNFLSLYNNGLLTEISKQYSLLVQKRDKEIKKLIPVKRA